MVTLRAHPPRCLAGVGVRLHLARIHSGGPWHLALFRIQVTYLIGEGGKRDKGSLGFKVLQRPGTSGREAESDVDSRLGATWMGLGMGAALRGIAL